MRKLWGILLFILVCNATSLMARVASIDPATRAQVICYIDEQSEEDALDNRPESFGIQQSETSNVGLNSTTHSDKHTSKSQISPNSRSHSASGSNRLNHNAYTIHHSQCEMRNFSSAKDLYIYAFRHIII